MEKIKQNKVSVVLTIKQFNDSIAQARNDALEEAAKIAENNFMNGVLPGTVSVRDFIAQAIRQAKEIV